MGDRLGLYRALAGAGALTPGELGGAHRHRRALRPRVAQRPGRRRLRRVPPGARVATACRPSRPSRSPTRTARPTCPGSSRSRSARCWTRRGSPTRCAAAPASAGTSTTTTSTTAASGSSGPATTPTSSTSWLPALDGVVERLERGARVADVGCGHGASTILMAGAFPNSTFVGSDYHAGSIETARRRAEEAGVADRVRFEAAPAAAYTGEGYELVTMFDCLHDMGDPVGAARHVLRTLAPDGTWMIVEPAAGDRVEDNLNPVGRAYYGFSTLLCTPASLSQDVGLALGAQAGPARIARGRPRGRLHTLPPRRRDPVQPRLRSAAVRAGGDQPPRCSAPATVRSARPSPARSSFGGACTIRCAAAHRRRPGGRIHRRPPARRRQRRGHAVAGDRVTDGRARGDDPQWESRGFDVLSRRPHLTTRAPWIRRGSRAQR